LLAERAESRQRGDDVHFAIWQTSFQIILTSREVHEPRA
jgi:hypothetical protein